jgi:hypothetical protein
MKTRLLSAIVVAVALTAAAGAQVSGSSPPAGQNAGPGSGGGYGQHGGHGFWGGGMMGRGLMGTVTEVAADHYGIKTDAGEVYTVRFTADTRIVKQAAGMRGPGGGGGMGAGQGAGGGSGQGGGMGRGYGSGNPPQQIKATDVKVGDAIGIMGDIDATAKSVGATRIVELDPAVVEQMREMEANFGKTWLQGKVTAIDGTKIILTGTVDNASHTVVADENTTFRKRREPVTMADIQVGDSVRVEGAVKDGIFTATSVNVAGTMGGEPPAVPRSSPPQ